MKPLLRFGGNEVETLTLRLGDGGYSGLHPGRTGTSVSNLWRILTTHDDGV